MARKLFPYLMPHRWRIAWALLQVFLITGFELLKPWPLQIVIDNVLGGKPSPLATLSSAGGLLLFACGGVALRHFRAGGPPLPPQFTRRPPGPGPVYPFCGAGFLPPPRVWPGR